MELKSQQHTQAGYQYPARQPIKSLQTYLVLFNLPGQNSATYYGGRRSAVSCRANRERFTDTLEILILRE
jgi:hypothetical protein